MNLREAAQAALASMDQMLNMGEWYQAQERADALRAALAQKQEPVAWQAVGGSIWGHKTSEDDRPLYAEGSWNEGYKHGQWQAKHCAAHPQPAPLTDEQIDQITAEQWGPLLGSMKQAYRAYARAIECHHGIVPAPTTDTKGQQR